MSSKLRRGRGRRVQGAPVRGPLHASSSQSSGMRHDAIGCTLLRGKYVSTRGASGDRHFPLQTLLSSCKPLDVHAF